MTTRFIRSSLLITIGFGIVLAGCQFGSKKQAEVLPSPKSSIEIAKSTPYPIASESAALATPSASTTKGGVLGTSTPVKTVEVKKTNSNLFDTSFDTLEVTNFPGQTQNATLTLKNNSNEPVLWYIKLAESRSGSYPISVNDTNEVTGTLAAHATTSVSINTQSTDSLTQVVTSFPVVFIANGKTVASKTIKVTVHSPNSDRITINSTNDASATFSFKDHGSYGIRIVNKHGKNLNWSATITQGGDKLKLANSSGYFLSDYTYDTSVYFTTSDHNGLREAKIEFTFSDDNHVELEKHTLTLHIE